MSSSGSEAPGGFFAEFWRAPAAIAAIGLDGRILACNDAYGEIVGAEAKALVGTDAAACVMPGEVDQAVAESLARFAERTSSTRPAPIRLRRCDGTTVWVHFDTAMVDDNDPPYVLATMTDVSFQVESQRELDRGEAWVRTLLHHQSDMVTVVGFDGIVRYISPNCERLLGFRADELIGTSGLANIHPDDVESLSEGLVEQLARDGSARPIAYRQRRRDGSWLWLEATGRQLPAELGAEALVVNARDVSERRRAEAAVRAAEHQFRSAFSTSPLGIGFADLDGQIRWANRALTETLGIGESQLLTMNLADFTPADDLANERRDIARLLRGEIESVPYEKKYEHPERHTVWIRVHLSAVCDVNGTPNQLLCQVEDITEHKQREFALSHDALHDPLTGLLNRAGLREHLDLAWAQRCTSAPLAVLFGDLDGFKHVNDTLGHDAGDEVVVHVAQRLNSTVRAGDIVARWGGDEFVILCPAVAHVELATTIAERVRTALEVPIRVSPGLATIGISIGVAIDAGQPLPDLLLKDADAAAYAAKQAGRNQVVVAR